MPYTISDADKANMVTQAGYALTALNTLEAHNPPRGIDVTGMHRQLNACAIITENAMGLPRGTFGGNGNYSGTTPQSGGIIGKGQ